MADWVLLIIIFVNGWGVDVKIQTIPMLNKQACEAAAQTFAEGSSKNIGTRCLSTSTGELGMAFVGRAK